MEYILPELKDDFDRWVKTIDRDAYTGENTLGIIDVLRAHYLIVDFFVRNQHEGIGGVGPKDLNLLHSTLSRQKSGYAGFIKWKSELEICATLFYGLVKNHAFHDANKRTAFLSLLYHLKKVRRVVDAKQNEFTILAIRVASNELRQYPSYRRFAKPGVSIADADVLFIADFLQRKTRREDREEYLITYNELSTILGRFNFRLDNPDGNRIDVLKNSEQIVWKGFRRVTEHVEKRVGSINFPGWTRQVCVQDIKFVRRMTNLTTEHGYDSNVFFHGALPFSALIDQFQEPLKRLSDK